MGKECSLIGPVVINLDIQMTEDIIKSIVPYTCPHCNGEIYIEFKSSPPVLNSVYTPGDVAKAKEDLKARIAALSIDDDKKRSVLDWLDKPDAIFGPNEVDSIVTSLLK